jgi:hypothetical protein
MSPATDDKPRKEPDAELSPLPQADGNPILARSCWCLFLGAGVILAFLGHGVLQERIMAVPYDGENFESSTFVVLCNRAAAMFFGLVMALCRREPLKHSAPLHLYGLVAIANFTAAVAQYEALKWVSFSVQMLIKSFKMIPVMLCGIAMSGKKYSATEWLITFLVTAGVIGFMAGGDISSPAVEAGSEWQSLYGVLLLLFWLVAESFNHSLQEKLFADYKTTKYNQMLYMNLFCSMFSMLVLVANGELVPSLVFCAEHPRFALDALSLSGASVTGAWFMLSMVKDFGALALAATMNVRQLLSILLSTWTYGHSVTLFQIFALVIIFVALSSENVMGMCLKLRGEGKKGDKGEGKKGDKVGEGQERPEDEEGQERPEDEEAPPMKEGQPRPEDEEEDQQLHAALLWRRAPWPR